MAKLIRAYDKRTGQARLVPENWFDHDEMKAGLSKRPPSNATPVVREGHDSPVSPDAPDYPVAPTSTKNSNTKNTTKTPPAGDK